MNSRLRKNSKHVFDCFLEVVGPSDPLHQPKGQKDPWILQSYPPTFKDKEADKLKSVPHFVFPCPQLEISAVQNFSFVLTDLDAHWTFGFCRIAPKSETALVILSSLPWHEIFYRLLNRAAEITHHSPDDGELWRFLEATYTSKIPDYGSLFHVSWRSGISATSDFSFHIPQHFSLPSIPDNRNLTEYYNACGVTSMLSIFSSMLKERRIIVTSRKLSRLSACVQAANALIFPMHWQHIFIPVLPNHLIDYLSAPMPFLIGVPAPIMQRVKLHELGEVVILDADANQIASPFDDVGSLPLEVTNNFKRSLKNSNDHGGEAIPRAFLQCLAHLIGGYRDALKLRQGEPISFDDAVFVASRPLALQPFLQEMLHLQIFRQFIEERIDTLNRGNSLSDEFEKEAVRYADKVASSNPGSRIIKNQYEQVKKEGGALVKAVKNKANPAMKTAVKSVREGGKSAYREIKHKMKENQSKRASNKHQRSGSPSSLSTGNSDGQPQSAPGSPSYLGGRRTMSVMNVATTGGSLSRENTATGGSGKGSVSSSGLPRYNTEFGFNTGRVLKYERFDPPPVGSLTSTLPNVRMNDDNHFTDSATPRRSGASVLINEKSPEMEAPPRLDLDLMTDMHDMIYRKPSPIGQHAPPVNRELKPSHESAHHPSLTRASMNSQFCNNSTAQVLLAPDKNSGAEIEIAAPFRPPHLKMPANQQLEKSDSSAHPRLERASGTGPLFNNGRQNEPSAVIDLISLGNGGQEDDIFDPLLLRKSANEEIATFLNSPARPQPPVVLPRPPSAKVAAITQMYEQHQQHKPLQRPESTNPFRNGNNTPMALYENCYPTNGEFTTNGGPMISLSNQSTPARTQRSMFTKSSEDLLKEYGLDFTKLSMAGSGNVADIYFEAAPAFAGVTTNKMSSGVAPSLPVVGKTSKDKFDIFADLDPLQSSNHRPVRQSQPNFDPLAPVAPPRGKKTPSENTWTTFE